MTPINAEKFAEDLMEEIVRRRKLGGYNPDAGTLLLVCRALYEVIRHINDDLSAKVAKPSPKVTPQSRAKPSVPRRR